MKKSIFLLLTAAFAAFTVSASTFTKLADFNLLAGDEVVITMAYEEAVYALNGDDATGSNVVKSDTIIVEGDAISDPDAKYVFVVGEEAGGWTFTRADGLMLYLNSTGIHANKASYAKEGAYVWKISHDYLCTTFSEKEQLIGVYHRQNNDNNLKIWKNYEYSESNSAGFKYIKGETLAFFVHRMNKVTLASVEGGTLLANPEYAETDALVEITLKPNKGFDFVEGSLVYSYMDGENEVIVPIEDNQFKMPNGPVTVTAEFEGHAPLHSLDFTNAANEWGLPTGGARLTEATTFYLNGQTDADSIVVTGTGNTETGGGYWWSSWGGGYLLFGKKDASILLPEFTFNVSKIVVTGRSLASEKTLMNIFVGDEPVSTQTVGSIDENTYLIARNFRAAGNRYALRILNDNPAQVTAIDIYGTVPGMPEAPDVSVPAGLYKEAQSVELSCETADAKIYYTLDGKRPTETATLYDGTPIAVTENTTIRAIAITEDGKSEITTARYAIANVTAEGTLESPYAVADVFELNNPGWKAWVHGFIIDGFDPNIKVRALSSDATNAIAIADDPNETDQTKMSFVELPNGKIRTALNVADNPGNKGKEVWVYGTLSNYGGQPGVSKVTKYYLDQLPEPEVPTGIENDKMSKCENVKMFVGGQLFIIRNGEWYTVTGVRVQ